MRDCPKCSAVVDGDSCAICGWSPASRAGGKSSAPHDPNRFRCEWTTNGQRCRYPATSSESTLGGGPWYCRGHFRCAQTGDGRTGQRIVEESAGAAFPDYSAAAMVKASRAAFLTRPLPDAPLPLRRIRSATMKPVGEVAAAHLREPGEEG